MASLSVIDFAPIAIVGRGCILPGAACPDQLWENVATKTVHISDAPAGNWSVSMDRMMSDPAQGYIADHTWSQRGGYVDGFDFFRATQTKFDIDDEMIARLDPLFQWSLFAAHQAISDLADPSRIRGDRSGLVLGNLSYPSRSHNAFAAFEILKAHVHGGLGGTNPVDPLNRFNSGLPPMMVAKALGITGGAFALDAACASGIVAIKQACDRLQSGELDFALAGAINAADPLFIHIGFCALNAMSRSGQSRPFHQQADGLIPAEGAAFVGLKRLYDAIEDGDNIFGVIRGIGLSNDGRTGGFLSPAQAGQVRAIKEAFLGSGLTPENISYIECHATGTPTGDGVEIESIGEVYTGDREICLGSLKANIGHTITASGIAGLIKTLSAIEHQKLPPTPNANPVLASIETSSFRVTSDLESWHANGSGRMAAVSSFGFGGNNGHLLVEEWSGESGRRPVMISATIPKEPAELAVVGMSVKTHLSKTGEQFARLLVSQDTELDDLFEEVSFGVKELAFPPADLKKALGQQLLILDAATEALSGLETIDRQRTGVYIGMGTDPEVCRYGVRWRLPDLMAGMTTDADWLAIAQEKIVGSLTAADVIGKMPNIPANRLSNQFDMAGPGFTVSREELSGNVALESAFSAIARGEIDAALVGAVDLSRQAIHQAAANALFENSRKKPGDASVVFIVKALAKAQADGDRVLAVLRRGHSQAGKSDCDWSIGIDDGHDGAQPELEPKLGQGLGHAHAAAGLINIAAAIELNRRRAKVKDGKVSPLLARNGNPVISVDSRSFTGEMSKTVSVTGPASLCSDAVVQRPEIRCFQAEDCESLISLMKSGAPSCTGPVKLAIVGDQINQLQQKALGLLAEGKLNDGWNYEGIYFREQPVQGEIAFAFTGAASAYAGMGRELILGFPGLLERLGRRLKNQESAAGWAYLEDDEPSPFYQLTGSTFLCQLHTEFTRGILGIEPTVSLGLSSGETNGMFAFGVWQDIDALFMDLQESGLYDNELTGQFHAVAEHWGIGEEKVFWDNWHVLAPVDSVKRAIEKERRAYLTIVNTDNDCVIGGDRDACRRVLESLDNPTSIPMGHDLAVHCAALTPFADKWRQLHTRHTSVPEGIRFYSNFFAGAFDISEENVAEALTGQALQTIDFRPIVEQAWKDGVRVFIEHGPRNSLSTSIRDILGDRQHVAIALDKPGVSSLDQAYRAAAELWCAGVDVNLEALTNKGVADNESAEGNTAPRLVFSLRPPEIDFSNLPAYETNKTSMDIYVPPAVSAGPPDGRLMLAPPRLQRIMARPDSEVTHLKMSRAMTGKPESISITSPKEDGLPSVVPTVRPAIESSPSTQAPGATVAKSLRQGDLSPAGLLLRGHQQLLEAHLTYLQAQNTAQRAFMHTMARFTNVLFDDVDSVSQETPTQSGARNMPVASPIPLPAEDQIESAPGTNIEQPAASTQEQGYPGPAISREELKVLAGGQISSVFGPLFEQQDQYGIQVRMPEPPLLLCDRVLGIEGEQGSLGKGTIWTQTDVKTDSWYLQNGRMPAGIFIESGQADLLLISWLGVDFLNKGDRAYRLLGCEVIFHGDLPKPGETLEYEIKVDGHASQGDVRLFFFHYDCHIDGKLRISVRNGQAGFFTKEELAVSAGVLWEPELAEYTDQPRLDPAPVLCRKKSFSKAEVEAFTQGELETCFGEDFYWANTHTRTPTIPVGVYNFLGAVTEFDLAGGPTGRGYMRVETPVRPDDWFFEGHFKNDPCMPGTLMADATLQTMAFYLAASGYTLHRDGWRFQPVRDQNYKFVCRGQVTPESKRLVYELFVDEIIDGDEPILFAHVLCSVDGRKAFLCERLGLQLIPDWPLTSMPELNNLTADPKPVASIGDLALDFNPLIHCAWGQPSKAFGPEFNYYDGPRRSPRLPGPPYHFMTRVNEVVGELGSMKSGGVVEVDYDIPENAWYFQGNSAPTMPYCVLMEIGLQPCGWLASYTLSEEKGRQELLFRNLDGTAVQHREVRQGDKTITTRTEMISISNVGDLVIVHFMVRCSLGDDPVLTMDTVFGFFPADAMINQKGLPISDEEQQTFQEPANYDVNLSAYPEVFFADRTLSLPATKLLMLDRITGYWQQGGKACLGAMRAEKDVNSKDWFFKSHFFQDPVQPGSLGVESMIQLIQAYMIECDMHRDINKPRFEPITISEETEWHYRGQVTPDKKLITVDIEITERGEQNGNPFVICEARLWVDGLKIYHVPKIGVRIVEGEDAKDDFKGHDVARFQIEQNQIDQEWSLDLTNEPWIKDHRPTYTIPALPMTCEVDMMARAASARRPARKLVHIPRATAKTWMAFFGDTLDGFIRTTAADEAVETSIFVSGSEETEAVATAKFEFADNWPELELVSLADLDGPEPVDDIYESGKLFHGPAFQLVESLTLGANGANAELNLDLCRIPPGLLNPGMMDAALHCIPHDEFYRWSDDVSPEMVAYPLRIDDLYILGPVPTTGQVRVEARFVGVTAGRFPKTHLRLSCGGSIFMIFDLVEVLMPKGPLGILPPADRLAFLRDRTFVPAAMLSRTRDGGRTIGDADVLASNWLPGTLEQVYGVEESNGLSERIVMSELVANVLQFHPGTIVIEPQSGRVKNTPLNQMTIQAARVLQDVTAHSDGPAAIDWRWIRDRWIERTDGRHLFIHDLGSSLIKKFVRHFVLEDPDGFESLGKSPVLYLANHQTGVESFLFLSIVSALTNGRAAAIAKQEHKDTWIGKIYEIASLELGNDNPLEMMLFDRSNQLDMLQLLQEFARGVQSNPRSLLVHVEGTRALREGEPVSKLSGVLIDLAVEAKIPILPVKFSGGLPQTKADKSLEFPFELGQQDYFVGKAIEPESLVALPYAERTAFVLHRLNTLGPVGATDNSLPGDLLFRETVDRAIVQGTQFVQAVLQETLAELSEKFDQNVRQALTEEARVLVMELLGPQWG